MTPPALLRAPSHRLQTRRIAQRSVCVNSTPRALPVPSSAEQQVQQAATSVLSAWRDGQQRQRLELLLPLIGATDLDDWPGGIRQQFKAAAPLVEQLLRQLKQEPDLQGPLAAEIWDQGDAVGAWYGEKLAAVLFPTASTVERVRALATGAGPKLLLIVNPQWELKGNRVPDFGFGAKAESAVEFVDTFQYTYYLRQTRVYGDDARVLRGHPGPWQIEAATGQQGSFERVATSPEKPSYQELEAALRAWPGSQTKKGLLERLRDELAWTTDSLKGPGE